MDRWANVLKARFLYRETRAHAHVGLLNPLDHHTHTPHRGFETGPEGPELED